MNNRENNNLELTKVKDTLAKELDSLNAEELHEFFMFFYRMNHNQGNMIHLDRFEEFLENFDSNPFKLNEDKKFKKQLIDNVIEFAFDHISLITVATLIKKKFTPEEIAENYYASLALFDGNLFY